MNSKFRPLIVEDNSEDRALILGKLRKLFPDLQAQEICDAEAFTRALNGGQFDLVLAEYQLHWTDGLRVLQAVKSRYPNCPVILFTATDSVEIAVEAMKNGLDDYVVKSPKNLERLLTVVRGIVDRTEKLRPTNKVEAEGLPETKRDQRESQDVNQGKEEFLVALAHELRNALSPILNAVHLLGSPQGNGQEELRDMLRRQIWHLTHLVDNLLDVSRGTTRKIDEQAPIAPGSLRILTIEDSRDAADSQALLLELAGHQVAVAYTGPTGVETAKKFRPDVVLCDIGLAGGMSGYDVARALRQDPLTADVKLIAITGYGRPEDRERGHEAGFDAWLIKPVSPEDLQRWLAREP